MRGDGGTEQPFTGADGSGGQDDAGTDETDPESPAAQRRWRRQLSRFPGRERACGGGHVDPRVGRAAGFIPAVKTAGINPAARYLIAIGFPGEPVAPLSR